MRQEIFMPRMGQNMDEGRVQTWLKRVGDAIERGEIIAEIETDKAVVEMEALVSGTIVELVAAEGALVPVGTAIAYVDDGQPGVEMGSPPAEPVVPQVLPDSGGSPPMKDAGQRQTASAPARVNASPVARRLAEELGIDLAQVTGSGPGGRINRTDVETWYSTRVGDKLETGVDDFKNINDDLLYAGLLFTKEAGLPMGVHAENDWVIRHLTGQLQAQGRIDRQAWLDSHPPETELEAINRALFWAKVTGGRLHVVHCTLADGVDAVVQAKAQGVQATVETCPVYLFYDESDFLRLGPVLKSDPPVRSRQEVERLWQRVLAGQVDVIGSDHSPSTWELKEAGNENIWKAWGGLSGVQTMLPVLLTEGVHRRELALPELVRMTSAGPARLFGVYPKKGSLQPGADADLTVVDLYAEWTLEPEMLFYQNKYSAYDGLTFKGRVEQTLVRGQTVYQDGKILVESGYGKYLRRGE